MKKEIKVKLKKQISNEEQNLIIKKLKDERNEIEDIKIEPIHSFGLVDAEFILSITISISTSIVANIAYDYGKLLIKSFREKNIEIELEEEENE